MTIMRGATLVRSSIVDFLEDRVPGVVDQARTEWQLDEFQLPYPLKYDAYEPYALDAWPLLGVNVTNSSEFNRVDFDSAMSQVYLVTYRVRVFTWVRTPMDENEVPIEPEYSESIRLRDDLSAVVRATILREPSLGNAGFYMDESTLQEEYSEATAVRGDRFVAGVIHTFDVRVDESTALSGIGTSDTITVEEESTEDLEADL